MELLQYNFPVYLNIAKTWQELSTSTTKQIGTYSLRFSVWIDAGLTASCEITVNFEGISRTALVRINPIFT